MRKIVVTLLAFGFGKNESPSVGDTTRRGGKDQGKLEGKG